MKTLKRKGKFAGPLLTPTAGCDYWIEVEASKGRFVKLFFPSKKIATEWEGKQAAAAMKGDGV